MEWLDGKNGVYKGTYQDVLKLLAQNSGLTMEMTYTPDMASSWELLADGRADVISGIVWTKELEAQYDFLHTDSFLKENYLILGSAEESFDFNSQFESSYENFIYRHCRLHQAEIPAVQIVDGDTLESCLEMVVNGKADIMLGNSIVMTTNRYLSKYASLMPVMTVSMEIPVGFGNF